MLPLSLVRLAFKRSTYGEWIVIATRCDNILRATVYKLYFLACFLCRMIASEGSVFVIILGHIVSMDTIK